MNLLWWSLVGGLDIEGSTLLFAQTSILKHKINEYAYRHVIET